MMDNPQDAKKLEVFAYHAVWISNAHPLIDIFYLQMSLSLS